MLDDHYNFTIATHNNPQHAPLLKGKKAEAPSLPDDTRLPAIAPRSLIDHPFVHPFKKRVEERACPLSKRTLEANSLFPPEFKPDTKKK